MYQQQKQATPPQNFIIKPGSHSKQVKTHEQITPLELHTTSGFNKNDRSSTDLGVDSFLPHQEGQKEVIKEHPSSDETVAGSSRHHRVAE